VTSLFAAIDQSAFPFSVTEFNTVMLIARVIAGATIFVHGFNKRFRGGKLQGTAGWFDSMGMKPNGMVHAQIASLTEIGAGILLVLGVLTPLAAAGLIGVMIVAAWTVHRHAFLITKEGFEYVLILATLSFVVAAFGPGEWSIDGLLGLDETLVSGWRGAIIALVVGGGMGVVTLLACYRPPKQD